MSLRRCRLCSKNYYIAHREPLSRATIACMHDDDDEMCVSQEIGKHSTVQYLGKCSAIWGFGVYLTYNKNWHDIKSRIWNVAELFVSGGGAVGVCFNPFLESDRVFLGEKLFNAVTSFFVYK